MGQFKVPYILNFYFDFFFFFFAVIKYIVQILQYVILDFGPFGKMKKVDTCQQGLEGPYKCNGCRSSHAIEVMVIFLVGPTSLTSITDLLLAGPFGPSIHAADSH